MKKRLLVIILRLYYVNLVMARTFYLQNLLQSREYYIKIPIVKQINSHLFAFQYISWEAKNDRQAFEIYAIQAIKQYNVCIL